jgi:hypothetical protein
MLAIDPRPGNATSNCAADNIALRDLLACFRLVDEHVTTLQMSASDYSPVCPS